MLLCEFKHRHAQLRTKAEAGEAGAVAWMHAYTLEGHCRKMFWDCVFVHRLIH